MAFRYDWWSRGIGMESFEVFEWPSGTTGGAEANEWKALRYSYGLSARLEGQRHFSREPLVKVVSDK